MNIQKHNLKISFPKLGQKAYIKRKRKVKNELNIKVYLFLKTMKNTMKAETLHIAKNAFSQSKFIVFRVKIFLNFCLMFKIL